jgi:hypothetical protein
MHFGSRMLNHQGMKAMFEKIVLATDLSTDWDQITRCIEELRALGCTRAILTHVLVTQGLVGADLVAESAAQPKLEEKRDSSSPRDSRWLWKHPLAFPHSRSTRWLSAIALRSS